jgi:hypothetical protein
VVAAADRRSRRPVPRAAPPDYDPASIYGENDNGGVPVFANTMTGAPAKGRSGSGPVKGRVRPLDGTADDGPSEFDYLDAALAEAEATPDTGDDRSALSAILGFRQRAYQSAVASGDPRQIAQARRDLTSAEQALKEVADNTAALAAALTGLQAEMKRSNDLAENVRSTSEYQLTKTLADLISGHIVGRGVIGRSFTPGSGVSYAY